MAPNNLCDTTLWDFICQQPLNFFAKTSESFLFVHCQNPQIVYKVKIRKHVPNGTVSEPTDQNQTISNLSLLLNARTDKCQLMIHMTNISRLRELETKEQGIMKEFIASIAHEFRTPLNALLPMSSMLQNYITDTQGLVMLQTIQYSA